MTLYDFLKRMSSIKNEINILDTTMVFHFRISTSGNIDKGNCHPYPVSSDTNKLRLVNCETNLAVAHNGIIHNYNETNKPIYKEKIENILTSDYEINGTIVDEEEYELMIDYLETIPYGVTIYLKDGISEYNYYDKNIYIDTVDKTVYHISNNKISYVGEYI